jgi:hypothetical protein
MAEEGEAGGTRFEALRVRDAIRKRLFGVEAEPIRIGRFEIRRRLGAGAMGVVYLALDPKLEREVALKVVRGADVSSLQARLAREARALAKLQHPNVITVFDVGEIDHETYVAMEYVDGMSLGRWLGAEPRSTAAVIEVFAQAGRGLQAAHGADLVHRDFKPDNVLVGSDGRVRVTDFGLVRALVPAHDEVPASSPAPGPASEALSSLVSRHGRVGTPRYMSPEQHASQPASPRSDQFSFCVALYEAIEGAPPFAGSSVTELAEEVRLGRMRPPVRASRRLRRVLERGLALDPARRYPTMSDLLVALGAAPRRWLAPVLAVLAASILAIVASLVLAADPARPTTTAPVLDDPQCRAMAACSVSGLCRAVAGDCVAASDDDCAPSSGCLELGLCVARGGRCVRVGAAVVAAESSTPPASAATAAASAPPNATQVPLGDGVCSPQTLDCGAHGRCTRRGQECVATSAADCRRSRSCASYGRCTLGSGRCVAGANADCETSSLCSSEGKCGVQGGECVALVDAHCKKAPPCQGAGKCSASGGACVASSDVDCRSSSRCRDAGQCSASGGACVASVDADCRASAGCRSVGNCVAQNGRCVPGSDADCQRSEYCSFKGRCKKVGAWCE